MPSLPIKIAIVVVGLILYFFAISALLNIRRDKAEQKVLFDSIDYNRDGVLTSNQINSFRPCPQSNRTKLVARLSTIGPRITYDQFENDVSRNMIQYTLAPCAANAHLYANPAELSKRDPNIVVGPFFRLYDLDEDGIITWNQYNLVNKYHGKNIKGASDTFAYLDANSDWEVTRQQFIKTDLRNLDPKLPSSARAHAPNMPGITPQNQASAGTPRTSGAAGVAGAAGTRETIRDRYDQYDTYDQYIDPMQRTIPNPQSDYLQPPRYASRPERYNTPNGVPRSQRIASKPRIQSNYRQPVSAYSSARRYEQPLVGGGGAQRQSRYYDQGL